MREIKFRLWNTEQKFLDQVDSIDLESWNTPGERPSNIVLMQYTDLKDKNGVEIYEGDILAVAHQKYLSVGDERFYRNGYANRVVKWHVTSHHNGWNVYNAPQTQFEVIGNIYENPELMTKA